VIKGLGEYTRFTKKYGDKNAVPSFTEWKEVAKELNYSRHFSRAIKIL